MSRIAFSPHDEKDVSKVFAALRARLQAKEKELLELQRRDPTLLAPDSSQFDALLDAIAALELSTPDGSFVFASDMMDECPTSAASLCSADFHAIKNLPSNAWLAPSGVEHSKLPVRRTAIVEHIFALPLKAYLPSPSSSIHSRIPIANHLLFMSINAFKPSSSPCTHNSLQIPSNRHEQLWPTRRSLLTDGTIYSKEYWLRHSSTTQTLP